jgi:4-aminobutyrate aminotransferase
MVKAPEMKVEPPGPRAKKIVDVDTEYLATSTKAFPLVVAKAKGTVVWDVDGNRYLDFASGVAVLNVGHSHPQVIKAITEQAKRFTHFAGTDFYYDGQSRLSERLCRMALGPSKKKVFLSNSGAESIEAAMKLARYSTERKQFISFIGAFHGRTFGALSLTASKKVHHERYFPEVPGVTIIPFGHCYRCPYKLEYPKCGVWCAKIIEELYFDTFLPAEEVAAVFMEPIQGEGGYIVPPKEFPQIISKMCKRNGILFVDDEVQAGIGRTGKMWAMEHYGVVPDIMCSAKSLGSGVPIAATIFRRELDWSKKGAHSNTYGGNALACAAALATLDIVQEEKLVSAAEKKGKHLRQRLMELQDKYEIIGDVRGLGLMLATEFVKDRRTKEPAVKERDQIEELAFKRGLLLLGCGRSAIRYIPPLTTSIEQIDAGVEILDASIGDVVKGRA